MTELSPILVRGRRRWAGLTLAQQFLLAGAAILLAGMLLIGLWVAEQIERAVIRNTAAATALYVDSVIAPILPDIRDAETLPEGARRALDEVLARGALGQRLASFKIWKKGGLVAYSSRRELIGRRFEPTETLRLAWDGQVAAEFDSLEDAEDRLERAEQVPLLEIYSPIREPWSGEVVAVAEFYERAADFRAELARAQIRSWLVVALVTLAMLAPLSLIVLRGNRVIGLQQSALQARVRELSEILAQNQQLRRRVQAASNRVVALNEHYLRRISADLHDGPAQLLAFAALRIPTGRAATPPDPEEMQAIRSCLDEAMQEIRGISRDLALPQVEGMELCGLVRSAVAAHEQRTGTSVATRLPEAEPPLTQSERICIYRFLQEGLSNASRHAGGRGQEVAAEFDGASLTVAVSDGGPGFDPERLGEGGLGLDGLRYRVESCGGSFRVQSTDGGTRLSMTLRPGGEEEAP